MMSNKQEYRYIQYIHTTLYYIIEIFPQIVLSYSIQCIERQKLEKCINIQTDHS